MPFVACAPAVAAAAENAAARVDLANALPIKTVLIVFGLATSVPADHRGIGVAHEGVESFPILVWAGAALLGWVAGEIIVKDAAVASYLGAEMVGKYHLWAAAVGAVFVVATGYLIRRTKHKTALEAPLIIDSPGPYDFPETSKRAARDRA